MIQTSYFAKMRKMTPEQKAACVSVARFTPKGINIPGYDPVMPSKSILLRYKEDEDVDAYAVNYEGQLSRLDVDKVAADLDGKILLCYEKSSDFCHRHLLASWLNRYGYYCKELEI